MWNGERGNPGEGENPDANNQHGIDQSLYEFARARGLTVGDLAGFSPASQFNAYGGAYGGSPSRSNTVPLYGLGHQMQHLHEPLAMMREQEEALRRHHELQRVEFTRQQLELLRQQEEVRHAQAHLHDPLQQGVLGYGVGGDMMMHGEDQGAAAMAAAPPRPRGKPEALAMGLAAKIREENEQAERDAAAASAIFDGDSKPAAVDMKPASEETPKKKRKRKSSASPKKRAPTNAGDGPSVDDPVPPITDTEYKNVDTLMKQFCRVPLLAEFSRPVALLHPELMSVYSKIVAHPIDLGRVCRNIRRRLYTDTRAVRIDMWRIFMNCAVYHNHPTNKDAVPSFVSIALHLHEYFNALWQEHMLPSDPPVALEGRLAQGPTEAAMFAAFDKREEDRKKRLASVGSTVLSRRALEKTAAAIDRFIRFNGLVDGLDKEPIIGSASAEDEDEDLDVVADNLRQLMTRLLEISQGDQDFNVEELLRKFRQCYNEEDLFENKPSVRVRIGHRIDRLIGQIIVPIYETSCRGVNQSSIWGCMAAAVWARESSKKPYWPALVLGIMAPEDQKEDWHEALTERNQQRLPAKLRTELQAGRRKAEQALKRQKTMGGEQNSYFLVEFMGTHEFIWVRELDIIENFDPDEDPNLAAAAGNITKKKRSSRSHDVHGTKTFSLAIEEGRWALDEFEAQLSDTCGDLAEEEEDEADEQEMNYSYAFLAQSDDEADEDDGLAYDSVGGREMTSAEIEEANELLLSDGLLDFSSEGRKNAKKRAAARKKQKVSEEKAAVKSKSKPKTTPKPRASSTKGKGGSSREDKLEQRELERLRKKRTRERDKFIKEELRKAKRRRSATGDMDAVAEHSDVIDTRRGRANAVVRGYLLRLAKSDEAKNLSVGNMMNIPASALDSSGLLGMALAFRAAAGAIEFQDGSDTPAKPKPWDALDVDGPKTSAERVKKLEKQAELLEAEILRVKEATAERKRLTALALKQQEENEQEILSDEAAARQVIHQKAKKKPKSASKPKKASDPDSAPSSGAAVKEDEDAMKVEVQEEVPGAAVEPGMTAGQFGYPNDAHLHQAFAKMEE